MSQERAGYDHATRELDRALADVEDAYRVWKDSVGDLAGALRRAEFGRGATMLQQRAKRMLHMSTWANAPSLASALELQRKFFHHAQSLDGAAKFLPEVQVEETDQ